MNQFTTLLALVGIVVVVACLLSGALERSRLPVVVVFLALGALLGPWGLGIVDIGFQSPELQVLATLALALVLFSDAVTLETTELRSRRRLLFMILGPGTLVPAALVALAAYFMLGVSAPAAAILGAALASTDPVLLRTVVRSPAVSATARIALRMETGMNDIVLLPIVIISMLVMGGAVPHGAAGAAGNDVARSVLGLFLLGPALGALVGWAGISVLSWVRSRIGVRRDYESLYALGLAFSAFAAAEAVGGSGFVAAFAAGLLVAAQDIELCDCFLEYGEASAEMFLLLTFVALGTTLIWTGLGVIDGPTLLFAVVAVAMRTIVLYPVLGRLGLEPRDRRLIALLGPRGLSSLLLTLLPVFAGVAGAERLFAIACLVVLLSVVLHGGGIALFLRDSAGQAAPVPALEPALPATPATIPSPLVMEAIPSGNEVPERITLDELRDREARGEPTLVVDVRKDRNLRADPRGAVGAIRMKPDDAVREATARGFPREATLALFCA